MTTRWKRFYQKQMEDAKLRGLVESELENLQLGVQIAKLRAEENLSQTKLAARAEMSAPKISAMENEQRNLAIGMLIRVAQALDSRVEVKLVEEERDGATNGKIKAEPGNVAPGFSPAFSWALSREATRCALRGSGSSNPVSGNRRADSPVERSKGPFERDSTRCTRRLRPWPPVCARRDRNSAIAKAGGQFSFYSKTPFVV